ncbi:Phenylalanine--tRNA ligase, mitochondrial [Ceratocystis fimbriata CBS 114723]|uniref:Phenylalanine--tRNA ligase, mitochondrial n=1 Tax=Ceratocystis fimbriata CBS 114723 TaxID=1035309 RepID=A0A2C5WW34_9PEZI|nr:Phenylalanine--tRNA ligase, mitochondrial [Ceratocystis fimbriata CBS 114723]
MAANLATATFTMPSPARRIAVTSPHPQQIEIASKKFTSDTWFNVPPAIQAAASRQLHQQKDHPVNITRQIIESHFPAPTYLHYNSFHPVVNTTQNFDSLGFPANHPGRSRTDTYYINESTLLRTHTSAHQAEVFAKNASPGFLISADVYRRDAVDRSHYPVFHQMEGARMWDRLKVPNGDLAAAIWKDVAALPTHDINVEDPNASPHAGNPLQPEHSESEAEAVAAHLKRSLELMVIDVFTRARRAAQKLDPKADEEPLKMRWVESYFPFTSPSWELEVYYDGDWLEVLGSGVVKHSIVANAGVPNQVGWAFGIGLERIAMLLFQIPDIRLFWSQDRRFLDQFSGVSDNLNSLPRFVSFSKHPECYKDVSFWVPAGATVATEDNPAEDALFHENDLMELVRNVAGDVVEDVKLVDNFVHPKTKRLSLCYRINYRSFERTLTNIETNELHAAVSKELTDRFGVEIR